MQTIDNCNYNQEQWQGWNNRGTERWSQEDGTARQRRRPYHRSVALVSTNQLVTIAMRRIIRLSSIIVWFERSFHHINCIVIAGREAMFKWTRQWATHHSPTSSWTTYESIVHHQALNRALCAPYCGSQHFAMMLKYFMASSLLLEDYVTC